MKSNLKEAACYPRPVSTVQRNLRESSSQKNAPVLDAIHAAQHVPAMPVPRSALFGLQGLGDSAEARGLLGALAHKVDESTEQWNAQTLGSASAARRAESGGTPKA